MKRPYEITVVVRILANEEETQNAIEQIKGWIEQANQAGEAQGTVNRVDRTSLGRRKLAYEIEKQRDGVFVIFLADVEPNHITEMELNFKLSSSVLRHLVVRLEESTVAEEVPAVVAEPAATPVTTTDEAAPAAVAETPEAEATADATEPAADTTEPAADTTEAAVETDTPVAE